MKLTLIKDPPPALIIDTMRLGTRFADQYGNVHVWWLGHQLAIKVNGTWTFGMETNEEQET